MAEDPSSLWSAGIRAKVQSPRALLKIQGEALARQTGGALMAAIRQKDEAEDKEVLNFEIVVPALDNYRQRILNVAYRKNLPYPCVVDAEYFRHTGAYDYFIDNGVLLNESDNVAQNENEFLSIIQAVLQSPQVVSVAQSLIARHTESQDN